MSHPLYWTKERILDALRHPEQPQPSWTIIMRHWRTLNAAYAEAGIPRPAKKISPLRNVWHQRAVGSPQRDGGEG